MSTPQLKGVMIGAGFFAEFQAEAWRRVGVAEITAVCDTDIAKARALGARHGIKRSYASAEEMIEKEEPDFVDIVTRPDSHAGLAALAAGAGAAVICQKPLTPDYESSVRLVEDCESAGVRLIVHENWRWQPWYRESRRLVEAGVTGGVFHLGFRMRTGDGRGPSPYPAQPYFAQMPRLLIFETLVHFLDTSRYLLGDIRRVFCRTARLNPLIRGEDSAMIHLDFASGAQGLLDANRIAGPVPSPVAFGEMALEGEKAAIRMTPEGELFLAEYGGAEKPHWAPQLSGYKGDSVYAAQRHYAEALVQGTPAESEGRDYLQTVALVEACYQSASTGVPVAVPR